MNFVKHLRILPLPNPATTAYLCFLFLTLGTIYFLPLIINEPVFHVEQPKAVTSDLLHDKDVVVVITSENILYLDKKVTTLAEFKEFLNHNEIKGLYLKVDRRSSIGRVIDIWDLARTSGIQRVSVASDQEE